jgi:hypothetical protein
VAREQFQSLTEQMYYILLALIEPRCGVDISAKAMEISNNRIQPANHKFAVELMNNSSVFDSLKNDKLLGFREMCEDAGWEFVCTNGIMQVFVSNNPNIIPIQTDIELKGKLISKNVISKTVPIYLFLMVVCFFQLFFLRDILNSLWSNLNLITGANILPWFYLISAVCNGLMFIILIWILKLLREKYNFSRKFNRLV